MRKLGWLSVVAVAAALTLPAASSAGGNAPLLTLQKTVGLTPASCAAAQAIVVDPGTTVYYCYKVTNVSAVTFSVHALEDSVLGSIPLPNGGVFDLPPGGMMTATASAQINVTTRNVATWMATVSDTMKDVTLAAQQVVATAQSAALVSISSKAAPAMGEAALAVVGAALMAFGAVRLTRKRRDQA